MNARPMLSSFARGVVLGAACLASAFALPAAASAAQPSSRAPTASPSPAPTRAPVPTRTPATTAAPTSGPIRVTVDPGIDDASLMPQWIVDRNATVARELGLPGHEQWVDVRITGATYDYRVTLTLVRDGAPLGTPLEPPPCACNNDELLTLVGEQLALAAERATSTPVEPGDDGQVEPAPETEAEAEPNVEPEAKRRPVPLFTGLGKAGLALGAVGGAGVIAGAVMVGVNRGAPLDDGYQYLERDWRNPTGFVFLGVGGAVLVGGAVMVVLDVTRCQRNPNAPGCSQPADPHEDRRARTLRGAPWAAAQGAGMSLWGRF